MKNEDKKEKEIKKGTNNKTKSTKKKTTNKGTVKKESVKKEVDNQKVEKEAIEEKVYQQYPKSSLFKIVKNVIMLSTGPLEDSKLLEYYDSTLSAMMGKSPIDCYLTTAAIPEVTSPKREQDDIAPAELIPKLTKKGYMTSNEYEQLTEFYKVYHGLGGNGQAKTYYDKTIKLPIQHEELPK